MRSDFAAAAKFYEQVAQSAAKPLGNGMEPRPTEGPSFSDFLKQAGTDTVNNLKQGEAQTIQGLAGKAELSDIIAAVSQAEVSLQTVVAVRDKVIAAYQDVMRMSI
jgi:flagellar hook-basal body complex protein FliE